MKTGFNLLLWTTHVATAHFPLFEKLKAAGYDGVEIPLFEGSVAHFEQVGRAIRDNGLGCTTVTVLPDAAHSAISPDPASRQGALDHFGWAIECSSALGSEVLCGPFHQPLAVFSGAGPTEDEKARAAEVHRQAAEMAARSGLALAIEPLNRFECYFLNTMADARAYVRRVDHPNFGALYDTFHANIEEKDPVGCIAEDRRRDPPCAHLGERPRHARQGPRPLALDLPGAARGRLRRLAHDRGLRHRAARARRRDESVAELLPLARRGIPVWPEDHTRELGGSRLITDQGAPHAPHLDRHLGL